MYEFRFEICDENDNLSMFFATIDVFRCNVMVALRLTPVAVAPQYEQECTGVHESVSL